MATRSAVEHPDVDAEDAPGSIGLELACSRENRVSMFASSTTPERGRRLSLEIGVPGDFQRKPA